MGIGKSDQLDGQLVMFTIGNEFTFLRDLKAGDVFVIGTPGSHSGQFEVTVNHPVRRVMQVRYEGWDGRVKDSTWNYNDNDCGIVVGGEG